MAENAPATVGDLVELYIHQRWGGLPNLETRRSLIFKLRSWVDFVGPGAELAAVDRG